MSTFPHDMESAFGKPECACRHRRLTRPAAYPEIGSQHTGRRA
jgi:hypothetical protein